ncbi:MAG: hypothetical protein JSU73_06835 [candidate division WOR-3 bacterium]|nr:MAG: hypothetical protein JSU73_06835 [candidate division WOR-3 bacterium]
MPVVDSGRETPGAAARPCVACRGDTGRGDRRRLCRPPPAPVGPVLVALGFLPWIPLRLSGRTIRSAGADIVFGTIGTGPLTFAALIGASLAGVLGAIVGGLVGDAITDGLAGMFEGKMAEALRRHGIEEARTPLSTSMGKMSGCLLGAGIVLTVAWTVLRLPT